MSDDDFDAAAAAARATGDARSGDDGARNHAEVEGANTTADVDVGSESTIRDMLMNTDPSMPLEEVEDPYDPERGGTARVYRGIMKLTGVEGLPAAADIGIGAIEAMQNLNLDSVTDDDGESDEGDAESNGEVDML